MYCVPGPIENRHSALRLGYICDGGVPGHYHGLIDEVSRLSTHRAVCTTHSSLRADTGVVNELERVVKRWGGAKLLEKERMRDPPCSQGCSGAELQCEHQSAARAVELENRSENWS